MGVDHIIFHTMLQLGFDLIPCDVGQSTPANRRRVILDSFTASCGRCLEMGLTHNLHICFTKTSFQVCISTRVSHLPRVAWRPKTGQRGSRVGMFGMSALKHKLLFTVGSGAHALWEFIASHSMHDCTLSNRRGRDQTCRLLI